MIFLPFTMKFFSSMMMKSVNLPYFMSMLQYNHEDVNRIFVQNE